LSSTFEALKNQKKIPRNFKDYSESVVTLLEISKYGFEDKKNPFCSPNLSVCALLLKLLTI